MRGRASMKGLRRLRPVSRSTALFSHTGLTGSPANQSWRIRALRLLQVSTCGCPTRQHSPELERLKSDGLRKKSLLLIARHSATIIFLLYLLSLNFLWLCFVG